MVQYYLSDGQDLRGPFAFGDLIAGGLLPEIFVWADGMAAWQVATSIPALQPLLAKLRATPPAPPHAPLHGAGSSESAWRQSFFTTPKPSSGRKWSSKRVWVILGAGVLFLFAFGHYRSNESIRQQALVGPANGPDSAAVVNTKLIVRQAEGEQQARVDKEQRDQAQKKREWNRLHFMDYVGVSVMPGYEVGMFGGISGGRIRLVNTSGYRIEGAVVAVQYITSGGSVYKVDYVGIDHLAAHETIMRTVPDCVRGVELTCSIFRLAAPGISFVYDQGGDEVGEDDVTGADDAATAANQ